MFNVFKLEEVNSGIPKEQKHEIAGPVITILHRSNKLGVELSD